jgi:hypothetical protein
MPPKMPRWNAAMERSARSADLGRINTTLAIIAPSNLTPSQAERLRVLQNQHGRLSATLAAPGVPAIRDEVKTLDREANTLHANVQKSSADEGTKRQLMVDMDDLATQMNKAFSNMAINMFMQSAEGAQYKEIQHHISLMYEHISRIPVGADEETEMALEETEPMVRETVDAVIAFTNQPLALQPQLPADSTITRIAVSTLQNMKPTTGGALHLHGTTSTVNRETQRRQRE